MEFKRHFDANLPLSEALPSVARLGGVRYQGMGLRDLCDELHHCYRENATAKALKRMYTQLPDIAMTPAQAYDRLVRGQVEAVPIDALQGRIAATMLVPYPPGIPLIMPGERFSERNSAVLDYLRFAQAFEQRFPGFAADVHGLRHKETAEGRRYSVDCVIP